MIITRPTRKPYFTSNGLYGKSVDVRNLGLRGGSDSVILLSAFALSQSRLRANAVSTLVVGHGVSFTIRPMRTRASRDTSPRSPTQFRTMQPEQSTSTAAADPHATSNEQCTAEQIRTAVLASEQPITEQFLAANAALLA
jgi:hypothetical protein